MPEVSQGSSLLATLGFIAESLWDSRSLASIKIRVRCSLPGRSNVEMSSRPGNSGALARSVVAAPGDGRSPPPKTEPLRPILNPLLTIRQQMASVAKPISRGVCACF